MSDRAAHEDRAAHNEAFFAHLRVSAPAQFCDWETIGLFYAAVQLVAAFFDYHLGVDPSGHYQPDPTWPPGRNQMVAAYLGPVYRDYQGLYNLSRTARYLPHVTITPAHVTAIPDRFERVKQAVTAKLPP